MQTGRSSMAPARGPKTIGSNFASGEHYARRRPPTDHRDRPTPSARSPKDCGDRDRRHEPEVTETGYRLHQATPSPAAEDTTSKRSRLRSRVTCRVTRTAQSRPNRQRQRPVEGGDQAARGHMHFPGSQPPEPLGHQPRPAQRERTTSPDQLASTSGTLARTPPRDWHNAHASTRQCRHGNG